MKKISIILVVLATILLLIFVGCGGSSGGGDDDSGSGTETETLNSRVVGVWQFSSGSRFTELDVETLQYIQFNADGTGLMVFENEFGILDNQTIIYVVVNDNTMTINSDTEYRADTSYIFIKPDDSTLTLIDASANEISFTLQSEIPSNLLMKNFTDITTYRDLEVEPDYSTNLVWDGTYLWYEEDDTSMIFPFDPTTETLLTGSSVDLSLASGFSHIQAYQGGDFWSHCHCGADNTVQRRNPGFPGVFVDEVDTDTDLSNEISVNGAAWDGSNLWLSGYSYDDSISYFLKVDSNAEPDLLVDTAYEYDWIKTMTWDGTYLWAISYSENAVIQIDPDPSGFTTVATYQSPDTFLSLRGIASVGSDLYLLGYDYYAGKDKKGVIFKVTP